LLLQFANKDKSAACISHHVAANMSDMFCDFYLMENREIANDSIMIKATEEIRTDLEYSKFQKKFDVHLAKLGYNHIFTQPN